MTRRQSLAPLRNTVHRFTGVVDRFGSFPSGGATTHTLCLRDLRLADSDTPLDPDHWWFQAREVWTQAGLRVGDTVLFTAKVQRASKGRHDPPFHRLGNPRRQVVGFASTPRSVVVLRRRIGSQQQLESLATELARRESQLCLTREDGERLRAGFAALLEQHEGLQRELEQQQGVERQLRSQLGQEEAWRMQLQDELAEGRRRHLRLRRRLAVMAALAFGVGGLAGGLVGGALIASQRRSAVDNSPPAPALRR